jgi:hypothetical protein
VIEIFLLRTIVGEEVERLGVGGLVIVVLLDQSDACRSEYVSLSKSVAARKHTVSLDPQLALWYLVSTSVYVCSIVCKGYNVADFKLVFVVVEHEVSQPGKTSAYLVHL